MYVWDARQQGQAASSLSTSPAGGGKLALDIVPARRETQTHLARLVSGVLLTSCSECLTCTYI